ncbi:TldD/PmbA family protein, partial [bacterium]|nr:TldD/PmbA family protein [bacterium]
MKTIIQNAVDSAGRLGASYADIRIIDSQKQDIMLRNGQISAMDIADNIGFGVRVIVNGAWGFASSAKVEKEEIERVTALAVEVAKASSLLKKDDVKLAPEP